jgi:hypothetical protein
MLSQRDLKIVLWIGYAVAYGLAVGGPLMIDSKLTSHTIYPPRHYPHAILCLPIIGMMLLAQVILMVRISRVSLLYISVALFAAAIVATFPIFRPEIPHGNIFVVGATTAFFSAFTIFVWSMCDRMSRDSRSLETAGPAAFEYMKTLFTFARQGAFAGVTLFGVLFFAAFTTEFKYADISVREKPDLFLLNLNIAVQIAFYATYAVAGPVRYFFDMTLDVLSQFKRIATQSDQELERKELLAQAKKKLTRADAGEEDEPASPTGPVLTSPTRTADA